MSTRLYMPMAEDPHPLDPVSDLPPLEQSVRSAVYAAFGRSSEVLRVVVRPLWQNRFRVNVFVGLHAASAVIAHSYFVEVGTAGDILSVNPQLPTRP